MEPPRSTKDCSACAPCFRSRFDLYTRRRGRASRRRCLRTRNQRNRRRTGGSVHRILGDTRSLDPGSGIARHALFFFFFFSSSSSGFICSSLVFLAASRPGIRSAIFCNGISRPGHKRYTADNWNGNWMEFDEDRSRWKKLYYSRKFVAPWKIFSAM